MSYYEKFSFCPIQEYEAWEQYRLSAEDILVDEKYVVMMQLRQQVHKHKALRVPTRIIEIDRRAENIHVVRLNIDIPRLTGSKWHIESEMAEGYLANYAQLRERNLRLTVLQPQDLTSGGTVV